MVNIRIKVLKTFKVNTLILQGKRLSVMLRFLLNKRNIKPANPESDMFYCSNQSQARRVSEVNWEGSFSITQALLYYRDVTGRCISGHWYFV